jgi:hypothetical protein
VTVFFGPLIQFVECTAVDSDITVIESQALPIENCSELSTFVNPKALSFKVQAQLEGRKFVVVPSPDVLWQWISLA